MGSIMILWFYYVVAFQILDGDKMTKGILHAEWILLAVACWVLSSCSLASLFPIAWAFSYSVQTISSGSFPLCNQMIAKEEISSSWRLVFYESGSGWYKDLFLLPLQLDIHKNVPSLQYLLFWEFKASAFASDIMFADGYLCKAVCVICHGEVSPFLGSLEAGVDDVC